jgi:hypothetical protein
MSAYARAGESVVRQRVLSLTALVTPLVAGLLLWHWFTPAPGITKANFRRIKPGMTVQEVQAILGKPPDEETGVVYPPSNIINTDDFAEWDLGYDPKWEAQWGELRNDQMCDIYVGLDDNRKVVRAIYARWWCGSTSFVGRFRAWVGW